MKFQHGLAMACLATLTACASAPSPAPIASGNVPSQIPPAIAAKLQEMGRVVAPPPTEALYAPLQDRAPYAGLRVTRDVSYGPHARHLLDVFTPEKAQGGQRPVLLFVHGGAFTRGDRRSGPDSVFYDHLMVWAVRQGAIGVNMTYRLAPQHTWPAAQEDLASAIRWVKANIAAQGGDPQRIYLMGHSAGAAHVAQYIGHPQFHVEPGTGLAGAIMVSGLFNPVTAEKNPPLHAYFGTDASTYAARSALPGLMSSKLPMLFAYAQLDPQDFHDQNLEAQAALCRAGRACPPFLQLQGHSHMSELFAINTGDRSLSEPIARFMMGR